MCIRDSLRTTIKTDLSGILADKQSYMKRVIRASKNNRITYYSKHVSDFCDLSEDGQIYADHLPCESVVILSGQGEEPRSQSPNIQKISINLDAIDHLGGCLLYTSPSPRDRQKSRMPSSA
eukprot:TRINITY_DN24664_c0_g1_i1.p1 TRINITY_DN24664_c0_g1~~TRINITY_DN24664_c0_g1_i1.p1  ORF type:complete len:121 (+),score=19.08 TRINITY_DN24664_c0_g1_i1:65-427(+)